MGSQSYPGSTYKMEVLYGGGKKEPWNFTIYYELWGDNCMWKFPCKVYFVVFQMRKTFNSLEVPYWMYFVNVFKMKSFTSALTSITQILPLLQHIYDIITISNCYLFSSSCKQKLILIFLPLLSRAKYIMNSHNQLYTFSWFSASLKFFHTIVVPPLTHPVMDGCIGSKCLSTVMV